MMFFGKPKKIGKYAEFERYDISADSVALGEALGPIEKNSKITVIVHANDLAPSMPTVAENFFQHIDSRIEHNDEWSPHCPTFTSIAFPAEYRDEIISKLMQNDAILQVGREQTPAGMQFFSEREIQHAPQ